MDKQKLIWGTGILLVLVFASVSLYYSRPHEPVVLTYHATEPAVTEITEETEKTGSQTKQTKQTKKTAAEPAAESSEEAEETSAERPLNRNLNTADAEDLKRVNGIGDVLAGEIIAYRAEIGGFTRRAQLTEISGIGPALAERIMEEFEIPDELPPEEEPPEPEPEPAEVQDAPQAEPPEEPPAEEPAGPYDANTVTREELLRIPDMTEKTADDILALRGELGRFEGIYELMLTEGMKGRYFEDVLRNYLYVTDDPYSIVP